MDTTMKGGKEVVVTVPDSIGVISQISTVLSEARVDIRAMCAYAVDNVAHLRLITDDSDKAFQALSRAGFLPKESAIVMSEVSPHSIHPEFPNVSGHEVKSNYWCASAHSGEHALLVFSPKDNISQVTMR